MATDPTTLAIFSNPGVVNKLVDSFNEKNPGHEMSDKDRNALTKDPALAEVVFNGGIKDLIADGKTNVGQLQTELKEKPEVIDFLRHSSTQAAVKDGSITVGELARLSPDNLKSAEKAIAEGDKGHLEEAAKLLGLNEEKSKAFVASVEQEQARDKHAQQSLHHSLTAMNTPAQAKSGEVQVSV